jgi:hypothetical protein
MALDGYNQWFNFIDRIRRVAEVNDVWHLIDLDKHNHEIHKPLKKPAFPPADANQAALAHYDRVWLRYKDEKKGLAKVVEELHKNMDLNWRLYIQGQYTARGALVSLRDGLRGFLTEI